MLIDSHCAAIPAGASHLTHVIMLYCRHYYYHEYILMCVLLNDTGRTGQPVNLLVMNVLFILDKYLDI